MKNLIFSLLILASSTAFAGGGGVTVGSVDQSGNGVDIEDFGKGADAMQTLEQAILFQNQLQYFSKMNHELLREGKFLKNPSLCLNAVISDSGIDKACEETASNLK